MANGRSEGELVRRRHMAAVGLAAGGICGAVLAGLAGAQVVGSAGDRSRAAARPPLHVTHLPPLLRLASEPAELRYDVYCPAEPEQPDEPCAAAGSVFVRAGTSGPFRELRLTEERTAADGRFRAVVPGALARGDFAYYAVFRGPSDAEAALPEDGVSAPQLSFSLDRPVQVSLGAHRFGRSLPAATRVAEASWGDGPGEVRLEAAGTDSVPMGGSSFDVTSDGTVHVLDQAHRRVLRFRAGTRRPEATPVAINGTLADLAVSDDGLIHVLESTARDVREPLLRVFGHDGRAVSAAVVGEGAAQVRVGQDGHVFVHRPASGQWLSASRDGRPTTPATRSTSGRPGRLAKSGDEVIVLRTGDEIRVALVRGRGATRSWRITSATPLAEVQLAEPVGRLLVVVARVYTDSEDEFIVLVLDDKGLVSTFSVASPEWAEAAALSRFRISGTSLYRLGSTSRSVFVDRFDVEALRP